MTWLLTAILCVALVEVAVRMPFGRVIGDLTRASSRAVRTVRAPGVSDHWKERAMGAYAKATFGATLRLALLLALLLSVAATLTVGFDMIERGFDEFLLSWVGIGASVVFATAWYAVRQRLFA